MEFEPCEGGPARLPAGTTLRDEQPGDAQAIADLTEAAFRALAYGSHTEQHIVDALRRQGALTVSKVALQGGRIVGHVAVSPVAVSTGAAGWYGLGPLSVAPDRQRQGLGRLLTQAALDALRRLGASGCVVLGDPAYYGRFGFRAGPGLVLPGVPAGHFQALAFGAQVPTGEVRYHAAFEATGPGDG